MPNSSHSKRTKTFHSSWYSFYFHKGRPFVTDEAACDALEKFCRKAYYFKDKKIMMQKEDAIRMRLKGFLDLSLAEDCPQELHNLFATRIDLAMIEANDKAAKLARDMRKRFPRCKISSRKNKHFESKEQRSFSQDVAGYIHIHLPQGHTTVEVIEVMYLLKDEIGDRTLEPLFNSFKIQPFHFAVR